MGVENLDKIFNPKRIAVIGASDTEGSVGARLVQNLIGVGYKGAVYPVNPFRPTVQGITAYPTVTKIPWKADLAIIATPAHTVPQIIEECGESGILGVIIVSAGFRETGKDGEALEKQILKCRDDYGLRIIGPNSFGVMRPKIGLNATFANRMAVNGKTAFISQSAALCASVIDWAAESFVGFSAVVSTGSMLDVDLGDLIDYFGYEAQTRNIVLYVEFVKEARKFMSASRGFARIKPILVVKAGRFRESLQPVLSSDGALCDDDAVYDAAFRRAGIVRVETMTDLFNCAEALSIQPSPSGSNLTIITNAGGPATLAVDSLIAKGGKLSQIDENTRRELERILPAYCSRRNPVNILEEATSERFSRVMNICFRDQRSDGFLVIYTPQGATDPLTFARMILENSKSTAKPVLTVVLGEGDCHKAKRFLHRNGVLAFSTPEQAISAFMYMYSYTRNLELLYQTPEEIQVDVSIPAFREALKKIYSEGRQILTQPESLEFLAAYKIPTIETVIAKTPEEAESAASRLGYPVVMKVLSSQITRELKAEGATLSLWSLTELRAFFSELLEKVKEQTGAGAEFQGVILQPLIRKKGIELVIRSRKQKQFGCVIDFGMAGVAAEILKDSNVGFPPLNQVLARRIIEKTAINRALQSTGNITGGRTLEEILVKFSQLVIDFPEVKEIDVNPLVLYENHAVALDARIVIDPDTIAAKEVQPHGHLVIAPYPRKYATDWRLRNGAQVTLRPVKPEDETLLNEMFKALSAQTMRFRFFEAIKDISHETLTRYCNLDYDREVALVAETQTDKRRITGICRLIQDPGGKRGEYAVVVEDRWQGLGLGSRLIDGIVEIGKDMGLDSIYGYVMSDNIKMIQMCEKKGFKMESVDEETIKAVLSLKKI